MPGKVTTRFGLVRHSKTLWNEEKRIQGQQDSPLSDRGRAMASAWGLQLKGMGWQHICSSDLGRTSETSSLVNQTLCLPVRYDARLREQDWGSWTGNTLQELKKNQGRILREQERLGWLFSPPQGESRQAVLARSMAALTDAAGRWPGEKILVICHEGVIKCLLYHVLNRKFLPDEPPVIAKAHLHLLVHNGDALSLDRINFLPLITSTVAA